MNNETRVMADSLIANFKMETHVERTRAVIQKFSTGEVERERERERGRRGVGVGVRKRK